MRRGRGTPIRGVGFGTRGQPGRRGRVAYQYVPVGASPNPRRPVQWWQIDAPTKNVLDVAVAVPGGGHPAVLSYKSASTDSSRALPSDTLLPSLARFPGGAALIATGGGTVKAVTRKTAVWAITPSGGGRVTVQQAPRVRPPQATAVTGGGTVRATVFKTPVAPAVTVGGGRAQVTVRRAATGTAVVTGGGTVFAPGSPRVVIAGGGRVNTVTLRAAASGGTVTSGGGTVTIAVAPKGVLADVNVKGNGLVTALTVPRPRTGTVTVTGGGRLTVLYTQAAATTTRVNGGGSVNAGATSREAISSAVVTGAGGGLTVGGMNVFGKVVAVTGGGTVGTVLLETLVATVTVSGGGELTLRMTRTASVPLRERVETAILTAARGDSNATGTQPRPAGEPALAARGEAT